MGILALAPSRSSCTNSSGTFLISFLKFNKQITDVGEPHYDDPSLALLFSQLKLKTLQTAKGTSEISGQTEFNFVLQIARVFCRLGCHVLALDLLRTWSFARPSTAVHENMRGVKVHPPSPTTSRLSLFPLELGRARQNADIAMQSRRSSRKSQIS